MIQILRIIGCIVLLLIVFHVWLHITNPYAESSITGQPYTTHSQDGEIHYTQNYKTGVWHGSLASSLGYYKSGFLIVQNTLFGPSPIKTQESQAIIAAIHKKRFDPSKPYLISGDQFSVLYPRNLGVFYNQLLDPNTALNKKDWENRQRIYLQSVLYGIDGLGVDKQPRTTIVPIGPKQVAATQVHPGGVASDSVYGVLFAIDKLNQKTASHDGRYRIQTSTSAKRLLKQKRTELQFMVKNYVNAVQDQKTKLVKKELHLSSARDGVVRASSFYDNVVLWKTLELANKYGIYKTPIHKLEALKQKIKTTYWNKQKGFFNNDIDTTVFSSDWLIGYPTGFFDLKNKDDQAKAKQIVTYIREHKLASPFPIKYQVDDNVKAPWAVKTFVPSYGGTSIWSYWGAEYITLLAHLYDQTGDKSYLAEAKQALKSYRQVIVKYGGFPETFNEKGEMLQSTFYKSILITGWVVQLEHAEYLIKTAKNY